MKKDTNLRVSVKEALKFDLGVGEHLTYEVDDRILWESSTGDVALVECIPSNLPVHHRYMRRIEKKFKVAEDTAAHTAYMLYRVGDLNHEVCKWFEGLATEQGFESAFAQIKGLFFELFQCEPKSTDVMGKIKGSLPSGTEYYSVPLIPVEEKYDPRMSLDDLLADIKATIRRAGKHQIGRIGKTLYSWSQDAQIRTVFGFNNIQSVWEVFKASKKRLEAYK